MLKRLYEWIKMTVFNDFAFNKPFNAEPKWEDTGIESEGPERDRFVVDAQAIIEHYTKMAREYQGNPAYTTGAGNAGSDMLSGIRYAQSCLDNAALNNSYEMNCLSVRESITESRIEYEENHRDSDGYGTGTLGQIGLDIENLSQPS